MTKVSSSAFVLVFALFGLNCTNQRQPSVEERTIRAAYQRLSQYAMASGKSLGFELHAFRTVDPSAFGTLKFEDIATMPGGKVIDVRRDAHYDQGLSQAAYIAEWREQKVPWASTPEAQQFHGISAEGAFAVASEQQPQLKEITGLTTFSVIVTLEGQARQYQAAFLWVSSDSGMPGENTRSFLVLDHIAQGVAEAAAETLPFANASPAQEAPDVEQKAQGLGVCAEQYWSWRDPKIAQDWSYHVCPFCSGRHYSYAEFAFNCSCTSDCASTCQATVQNPACADEGVSWNACHVMANSSAANSDRQGNGDQTGARCAAGLGCVEKSCLLCLCGLTVGVNIQGISVSFASAGGPDWAGNLESHYTCNQCTNCGNCQPYETCRSTGQCGCDVGLCDQYCNSRGAVSNNSCAGNTCICYQFGGYGDPPLECRVPEFQNPDTFGYGGSSWWWYLIPPGTVQTCDCYYNAQCAVIGRDPPNCVCPVRTPPC
jgi:hypothetical protein